MPHLPVSPNPPTTPVVYEGRVDWSDDDLYVGDVDLYSAWSAAFGFEFPGTYRVSIEKIS